VQPDVSWGMPCLAVKRKTCISLRHLVVVRVEEIGRSVLGYPEVSVCSSFASVWLVCLPVSAPTGAPTATLQRSTVVFIAGVTVSLTSSLKLTTKAPPATMPVRRNGMPSAPCVPAGGVGTSDKFG
jgi:hypothetical protein